MWTAHVDADAHYNSTGWHEKRNPNAFFSTSIYLSINPDVAASGVNPLTHFDTRRLERGARSRSQLRRPSIPAGQSGRRGREYRSAAAFPAHRRGRRTPAVSRPIRSLPPTASTTTIISRTIRTSSRPASTRSSISRPSAGTKGATRTPIFDVTGYLRPIRTSPPPASIRSITTSSRLERGAQSLARCSISRSISRHNPDVADAHVDPLKHFLQFGIQEGRVAIPTPGARQQRAANSIAEGAANGTGTGVNVSWGGWISPGLSYTLSGDTSGGGFTINAATGVITVLERHQARLRECARPRLQRHRAGDRRRQHQLAGLHHRGRRRRAGDRARRRLRRRQ